MWRGDSSERCMQWDCCGWGVIKGSFQKHAKVVRRGRGALMVSPPLSSHRKILTVHVGLCFIVQTCMVCLYLQRKTRSSKEHHGSPFNKH